MHINDLPDEVLMKIFSYLPLQQYLETKEVCPQWKSISDCFYSWKFHPVIYDGDLHSFDSIYSIVEKNKKYISYLIFKRCKYSYMQRILESVKNLICLEIIMCLIDEKLLDIISEYTNLKKLSFQNSYTLCSEKLMASAMRFHNLVKLERLFLSNFALNKDNFKGLFYCKNISYLMVEKIRNLPQYLVITFIEENKNILKGLAVYGDDFTDSAVEKISLCDNLTHLRIIRCDNLTDKSLEYMKALNLQKLLIWNSDKFTTKGLISLFNDRSMKNLSYVSFSKISNLSLDVVKTIVKNCPDLRFIAFYRCRRLVDKENDIMSIVKENTQVFFE